MKDPRTDDWGEQASHQGDFTWWEWYNPAMRKILLLVFLVWTGLIGVGGASSQRVDTPENRQIDFALGLFRRGEMVAAVEEFDHYLKNEGWTQKRDIALFFSAECLRKLNRMDEAASRYEQVVKDHPQGEYGNLAAFRLGEIHLQQGKPEIALKYLQPLGDIEIQAELKEGLLYSLAAANSRVGNATEAIGWWQKLRDQFPESPEKYRAALGQGLDHLKLLQYAEAEKLLREWLDRPDAPQDLGYAEILNEVATCREKQNAVEESIGIRLSIADLPAAGPILEKVLFPAARSAYQIQSWKIFDDLVPRVDAVVKTPLVEREWVLLVANRAYQKKEWKDARMRYERALSLSEMLKTASEMTEGIRYQLAWCALAMKDWQGIDQYLVPVTAGAGPAEDYAYLKGIAAHGQKKWAEALEWFGKLPQGSKYEKQILPAFAESAYEAGRWKEAAGFYQELVKQSADGKSNGYYYLRAADAERQQKNWAAAAVLYASATVEAASATILEKALYQSGYCWYQGEKFQESLAALERFSRDFPKSTLMPDGLYLAGQAANKIKDTSREIQLFQRLVDQYPKSDFAPLALIRMAVTHAAVGNTEQVLKCLLRHQVQYPDKPIQTDLAVWLADALILSGSCEQALITINRLRNDKKLPPEIHEKILFLSAHCLEHTGEDQKALADYRELLKKYPQSSRVAEGRLGLVRTALVTGDIDSASSEIKKSLEMITTTATGNVNLEAETYLLAGDVKFARGDYEAAYLMYARTSILYKHPHFSAEALHKSALCKEKLGDQAAVDKIRKQLQQEYPDSPYARQGSGS